MSKLNVVLGENKATLNIGGRDFVLKPLSLRDIALAEERFGCDLEGLDKAIKKMGNVLFLLFLSAKKSDSNLTEEFFGDSLPVGETESVMKALEFILNASGIKEKNAEGTPVIQG